MGESITSNYKPLEIRHRCGQLLAVWIARLIGSLVPVVATCVVGSTGNLAVAQITFFDDGTLALTATNRPGVMESPVPIFHNGALIGGQNHQLVEASDLVVGTGNFPLTLVDLAANTFIRPTYQKSDGSTGTLATSVVGSASYRTASGLQFIPTVTRADVFAGNASRYTSVVQGNFAGEATVGSTRIFPDPTVGRTIVDLSVSFQATQDISLDASTVFINNDRLRMMTVSSMFASNTQYDANVLRYEDANGRVQTLLLQDSTSRNQHLLPTAVEIGSWFEVVKGDTSTFNSDSSTIRVDIRNSGGLRLGLQGFLDASTDPNDDSLSVWVEVLDAPDTISAGRNFNVDYRITATPPVSCTELLGAPASSYQSLVEATLAQTIPQLRSLIGQGDESAAFALQQSTISALVQEAGAAASSIRAECVTCNALLSSRGDANAAATINNICVAEVHRVGAIQAEAISRLESSISLAPPSRVALAIRDRYLQHIRANTRNTNSAISVFSERYSKIIRRHLLRGDTAGADAAMEAARAVLLRTATARVQRIDQLCTNFISRAGGLAGAHRLVVAITEAASIAMAEVLRVEKDAMQKLVAVRGTT